MKQQAEAGDIVLLSADESEALTHPYLAHAWARRGADLRVPAPGQSRKLALIGALDHAGKLIVHRSRTKRSTDFIGLLERLDPLYEPNRPSCQASGPAARQRPDPYQQGEPRRSRRPRLAHCRMDAQICT